MAQTGFEGLSITNTPATEIRGMLGFEGISVVTPLSSNATYMTGRVAIFSSYNIALTSQEALQNYNALKSRFGLK